MELLDRNRLKIAEHMDEVRQGQEEWKSMRGNPQIVQAARMYGQVVQEIVRRGTRSKGVIDVSPRDLDRIIARTTRTR